MPKVSDLPEIAVIGIIKKRIVLGDNLERITILGEKRIKVNRYYNLPLKEEILQCDYLSPQIATISDSESTAMKRELIKLLKQYVKASFTTDNSILGEIKEDMSLNEITDRLSF